MRGVAVEAHWSLIVNYLWLPLILTSVYRDVLPDLSTPAITAMSLGSVLLLEASVVLHELGHALQARREGMGVERVLLWAFGGLAVITGIGRWSPGAGSFLDGLTRAGGQVVAAYPVIEDGRVVGVISPGVAAGALEEEGRTVAEVMVRKEEAVVLAPEMSLEEGYAALGGDPSATGVVLSDGRVVGILQRSDLADAVLEARRSPKGSVVPATPPVLRVDW